MYICPPFDNFKCLYIIFWSTKCNFFISYLFVEMIWTTGVIYCEPLLKEAHLNKLRQTRPTSFFVMQEIIGYAGNNSRKNPQIPLMRVSKFD